MKHSYELHKKLYALLKQSGMHDSRKDLVYSYSSGRTDNSAELTDKEIKSLIDHLQQITQPQEKKTRDVESYKGDRMRKRILSLCYEIEWITYSPSKRRMVVDFERLDAWMIKSSYLHKSMNKYSFKELKKLVSQFESMAETMM
jgi:hypothetical protein